MCNNCGIYKITSPTGKVYIGQTINLSRRIKHYKRLDCKHQTKLYNSLVKYGVSEHEIILIEACHSEDLNKRERYWQDFYNVIGQEGLNLVLQDSGQLKRVESKETRQKRSNSLKGNRNGNFNKIYTKEERLAISKSTKGKINIGENNGKIKLILDEQTGIFYYGKMEASKAKNINFHTLSNSLIGRVINKTSLIYV